MTNIYNICWFRWPRRLRRSLRPLAGWDCGFESRPGDGSSSVLSGVFCHVEVSASGWSLVQRSPTECGVSSVIANPLRGGHDSGSGRSATENLLTLKKKFISARCVTWCFLDRASWTDYILITNLMHWLLFIHKILFSSTCFEHQVLIFRRIQLYTCSIC